MNRRSDLLRLLCTVSLAVALALPAAAARAADADGTEAPARGGIRIAPLSSGADASQPRPQRSSRLRFRADGPTCMCGDGLSEREIRIAQSRDKKKPTQSTSP